MQTIKRDFSFIDETGKRARITAEVTMRNGYSEFTAMGQYDNSYGQCLDNIKPRKGTSQWLFLDLWKEYHLKDISKLPENVRFLPDFTGHLIGIIDAIEKEEKEREAKEEEKTGDDKILAMMEEEGIDEELLNACKAYLDAMSTDSLKDFQEAYQGQWPSDEDFAQDLAEQLGEIDENAKWPHSCIDWEKAAQELIMDYTEQNGFYFRNI